MEGEDEFYIILQGTALVSVQGTELARRHPGEVLGLISHIHHTTRTATVSAGKLRLSLAIV